MASPLEKYQFMMDHRNERFMEAVMQHLLLEQDVPVLVQSLKMLHRLHADPCEGMLRGLVQFGTLDLLRNLLLHASHEVQQRTLILLNDYLREDEPEIIYDVNHAQLTQ